MTDHLTVRERVENAHHGTRRVIRAAFSWLLVAFLICGIAVLMTAFAPLGILVHPPYIMTLLSILAATVSAPFGAFAFAYVSRAKTTWRMWASALFSGVLYFTLTLATLGWAIPVLSTVYAPSNAAHVVTVTGTSDLTRSRMGCHTRASFGSFLQPGGGICMDTISPHVRRGWVIGLEGEGNSWATRVSRFSGMR